MRRKLREGSEKHWTRRILAGIVALLLVWVSFFDSHSLYRRVSWQQELNAARAKNEILRQEIERYKTELNTADKDFIVEKVAREQYGMRRSGERVYRVEVVPEKAPQK